VVLINFSQRDLQSSTIYVSKLLGGFIRKSVEKGKGERTREKKNKEENERREKVTDMD